MPRSMVYVWVSPGAHMPRFKPLHITRRFLEAVIAKVHPMPQDMPVAPGWVWQGDGAERNLTVAGYRILRLLNGEDTQELDLEGDFLKNMRTVCELRRRLRNDCDEAVQHALTQAMIACAEAQTVMVHLAAEQVRHEETKAALEDARTRLTDFEDDFRRTLSEDCAPDERHCSCVPHLRQALRDAHRDGQLAAAERATPIVNDIATQRDMAVREVKRLRDEIEELRLSLLAEQGDIKGAPDGWKRTGSMWFRPLGPVDHQVEVRRSTIHPTGEPYHWTLYTPTLSAEGYAPYAREAMKRADKAFQEKT